MVSITLIPALVFPVVNFFAVYVIEKQGLRSSLIYGVCLQSVGFWLKQFVNHQFNFVIAGQVLLAIGQPIIMNLAVKVSFAWFARKERVFATSVSFNG